MLSARIIRWSGKMAQGTPWWAKLGERMYAGHEEGEAGPRLRGSVAGTGMGGEWLRMRTRTDRTELRRSQRACGLYSKWNIKLGKGLGRGTEERRYSVYVLKPLLWPQGVWAKVDQTWKAERPFRGCSVSQAEETAVWTGGSKQGKRKQRDISKSPSM